MNKFNNLKNYIQKEKKIIHELGSLKKSLQLEKNDSDKKRIQMQVRILDRKMLSNIKNIKNELTKINLSKTLPKSNIESIKIVPAKKENRKKIEKNMFKLENNEKQTLKRLKKGKGKEKVLKKKSKPSQYVGLANKIFSNKARSLEKHEMFYRLKRDLIKANLQFLPKSYISTLLLSVIISIFVAFFIFMFFMFFNIGPEIPFITAVVGGFADRFLKVFWILFLIPIATFFMMYAYPSLERKTLSEKIDHELPFATIHMAAISGSMLDPTNIFKIIVSTHDYPNLEKEFIKLLNEINVLGYDLVNGLRKAASNSASKNLSELFNGMATTINSGGNLSSFFEKRAQNLLFEYRLEKEKATRSAETFMDIYISVVIAAPMILMLLLMMMKISGLGISVSTSMITLIMILGVSVVNFAFLMFLHLKQPSA